jgi:bacteriocin-like protein
MKTSVVLGLFALMVLAAPVMAEENATFLALKDLPGQEQAVDLVQPLTDTELATIEGGQVCLICLGTNLAVPVNLAALNVTGGDFAQGASTGPQTTLFQP